MARKPNPPIDPDAARHIGALLRGLRKAAGFRAVAAVAEHPAPPAAQQTIYAYERGGLVPSLRQFLDLVEFYVDAGEPDRALHFQAIAAVVDALASPVYGIPDAHDLIARLQPAPPKTRKRREPEPARLEAIA